MTAPIATDKAHVGLVLRELRSRAELSVKDTARRTHISRRRLRDLEAGIGLQPSRLEVGLLMEVLADAIRTGALAATRDAAPGRSARSSGIERRTGPDIGGFRAAALSLGGGEWQISIEPTREHAAVDPEQFVEILDDHRRFAEQLAGESR